MKTNKRSPAASVLKSRLVAIKTNEAVVYEESEKAVQLKGEKLHLCGEMRLPKLSRKSVKTDRDDLIYVGKWLVFRFDLEKHGYVVRDGAFVNITVLRSSHKTNRVSIVERLYDDNLRSLSDMRTKPAWRKLPWLEPAIDAIYAERDQISKKTGIEHEVDHIHPVHHSRVCGLTVPWNLQVISATENRRKGNRFNS